MRAWLWEDLMEGHPRLCWRRFVIGLITQTFADNLVETIKFSSKSMQPHQMSSAFDQNHTLRRFFLDFIQLSANLVATGETCKFAGVIWSENPHKRLPKTFWNLCTLSTPLLYNYTPQRQTAHFPASGGQTSHVNILQPIGCGLHAFWWADKSFNICRLQGWSHLNIDKGAKEIESWSTFRLKEKIKCTQLKMSIKESR